eukprot:g33746.t1
MMMPTTYWLGKGLTQCVSTYPSLRIACARHTWLIMIHEIARLRCICARRKAECRIPCLCSKSLDCTSDST